MNYLETDLNAVKIELPTQKKIKNKIILAELGIGHLNSHSIISSVKHAVRLISWSATKADLY